MTTSEAAAQARSNLLDYLKDAELEWEDGARDGELVVTLPGERKLRTVVSVLVGDHVTSVAAFVIRKPDENHAAFYRHLLRRNLKLPGLAYGLDQLGDVYVRGTVPTAAVDQTWADQVFGVVLEAADEPFNDLLLLGFRTSMKKEWDWRVSRGESLANLEPFRAYLDGPALDGPALDGTTLDGPAGGEPSSESPGDVVAEQTAAGEGSEPQD